VVPKGRKPDSRVVARGPAGRGVGPRGVGPWGVGPRSVGGVDIEMMSMSARRRQGGGDEASRLGRRRQPPHKSHRTAEDHEARQQRCPRGSSRPTSATRHPASRRVDERKRRAWGRSCGRESAAQAGSGRSKGGLLARAALPPVLPVVAAYRTRAGVVNSTVGWLARAALRAALPASLRGSCGEIPRIERTNRLKPV
jgi:hypothetical protein